jgi:hypothetical protein
MSSPTGQYPHGYEQHLPFFKYHRSVNCVSTVLFNGSLHECSYGRRVHDLVTAERYICVMSKHAHMAWQLSAVSHSTTATVG